ncbi:ADP-heptose--LPS heptosyltransferase I [Actinobacillus succinogenes]|uniref:Glycosyl transferase family 9 n=1 Tax=Actinobacillus succinogenes (strain ATCC 55618 / DSM 22257 / CCUG 43843 / 130Z) TaxID=339671 RepID=A6VQT6_ACTSZ|nr:glycosyltransferase family 9 protein [Actinobacillus succinogenes]ABR75333.1 glycosyl transferase family 9 [Actinobacillus succinogenes 130Z]PHI40278.1 ADP-heptose--LPS heptosyltransferase I [Actinobacillus succinogenes]
MLHKPLFTSANPPASLCILRLSAIGDVTHALAVVQEIQRFYPKCNITWIVGKAENALLSAVTTGIHFEVYDKKSGWKGVFTLWKKLKNQRFDALLNMQTALRASILSLGIKAKYKIGFGEKRSREGQQFFVDRRIRDPQNPHVLDGFMAFAQEIGVPPFTPRWSLILPSQAKEKARSFLSANQKNLVIAPCSSKAEKDWLAEGYAAVANYAHSHNLHVVLCGSPAPREIKMTEKITALCDFQPTNICGQTTLAELVALIGLADVLIAPDSGPAHIATMTDTPVIGLYAYHNPWRTGPYRNLANVVSVYEQNARKEFGKPSAELPWATKLKTPNLMAQIQTDAVIAQLRRLGF